MGQTSSDVEREIDDLRRETGWIVDELEYRARRILDWRGHIAHHPYLSAVVSLAISAAVAAFVSAIIAHRRSAVTPGARLRLRFSDSVRRVRHSTPLVEKKGGRGVLKRVVWTMFATGMVALAGILARRLSAALWQTALKERPPQKVA